MDNGALYQTGQDTRLRSKDVERDGVPYSPRSLPPTCRLGHVPTTSSPQGGRTSVSSVLLQGWPAPMRSEVEAMCTQKAKRVQ